MPRHDGALRCRVLHVNFSPKGGLEGLVVEAGGATAQVVCPPHLAAGLARLAAGGAEVTLAVGAAPPSDKGWAAHPVYHLLELPEADAPEITGVSGTVARLNYAKHGEPNGVVLDTGDFVHLKPHGMAQLNLKVGDRVSAEGDIRPLEFGGGRAVEAERVNGVEIAKTKPKHH